MSCDSDISWQLLRRIVQEWAGTTAELEAVAPLNGGSVSTTLKLTTTNNDVAVLKITPHRVDRSYAEEKRSLELLREIGLPAPKVLAQETGSLDSPHSYLLLEFVPGVNLAAARKQVDPQIFDNLAEQLGEVVALMHAQTGDAYGKLIADPNKQYTSWPEFYRHVFDPVLKEAEKTGLLPLRQKKLITRLHERLDRLIAHDDVPRLVHWDIWAANVLVGPGDNEQWQIKAMLDPNCRFAHAEAEIAYVDLFKTASPAFIKAYQRTHKLDDAYHRVRKPIYQLYFLLNHLQLFGAEYQPRVLTAVERVASLV